MDKKITLFGTEFPVMILIGIAVGVIVILLIVLAVILGNNNRKKKRNQVNDSYKMLDQKLRNERNHVMPGTGEIQVSPAINPVMPAVQPANHVQMEEYNRNKTQLLFENNGNPAGRMAMQSPYAAPVIHRVLLTKVGDEAQTYQCGLTDKIIVGRNPACTNLAITNDRAVSEKHCEIGINGNGFYIKDLGSSNGTRMNGERITETKLLTSGAILEIGRYEYRVDAQ